MIRKTRRVVFRSIPQEAAPAYVVVSHITVLHFPLQLAQNLPPTAPSANRVDFLAHSSQAADHPEMGEK